MKKSISILVLLALVATGAFAIEMSAGGGALLDWSFNNGIEAEGDYMGYRNLSFGAYGFFDITYAEVDVSFAYGKMSDASDDGAFFETDGSLMQLGFSAVGKYPLPVGPVTLFPMLGISYNMVMSASFDTDGLDDLIDASDFNQFGFIVGGGVDYPLTEALYLRGELAFHLRLASKVYDDVEDLISAMGGSADTTFGMGPRFKIGVGYKF